MTVTVYQTRLFGGRNVGVGYDPIANTLSIMGQSISITSLPASLQSVWQNAIATGSPIGENHAFGGNISQAIGSILDATPSWRAAVQTALNSYVSTLGGIGNPNQQNADPETWIH